MLKSKGYLLVFFKGIAMGAADIVPGVSGGTIAFISGIYLDFINALQSISTTPIRLLFSAGPRRFGQAINAPFLLSLFSGMAVGILSLSKLIEYLLTDEPISIRSFFFGLVAASICHVYGQLRKKNASIWAAIAAGAVLSYLLTIAVPTHVSLGYPFLFLSGFSAIVAMMLPGISGAFILLLMGSYEGVIDILDRFRSGLSAMNWDQVAVAGAALSAFAVGALIGLVSFSRVLSWLFKRYKNLTLAGLTGFMIGSLNKLWPWKETLSMRLNAQGQAVPFMQRNVCPLHYTEGKLAIPIAITLVAAGFLLIFALEKLSTKPDV